MTLTKFNNGSQAKRFFVPIHFGGGGSICSLSFLFNEFSAIDIFITHFSVESLESYLESHIKTESLFTQITDEAYFYLMFLRKCPGTNISAAFSKFKVIYQVLKFPAVLVEWFKSDLTFMFNENFVFWVKMVFMAPAIFSCKLLPNSIFFRNLIFCWYSFNGI